MFSGSARMETSLLGSPLHTFSGGFREAPRYDETEYARVVAARAGTEHHEVYPTACDFVDVMPRLIEAMDEPAAGLRHKEKQALADRDAGTLLIRDCGSAADTSWIHEREDLPRLIRAGRHLARTKRYIRNYAHEIEPEDLPAYVAQEAQRGDGWVKLVGDWIERDAGDLTPSWTRESLDAAMRANLNEADSEAFAKMVSEANRPFLSGR